MSQENNLKNKRHSLAHLLAAAVLKLYPDSKPTLGPAIDNGFYYDFDFEEKAVSQEDLKKIEKEMKKLLSTWSNFSAQIVTKEEARKIYQNNPYKLELVDEITTRNEEITLYTSGDFTDLCRGGHIDNMQDIDPESFTLDKIAGAYWRGDEKNKMLTRIYGLAFDTQDDLNTYIKNREEAKNRDHRKLGKELDLFTFSDLVGAGLPLFTPKGTLMRDLIVEKIMTIQAKYGYKKVSIPHITKSDLYKTSGHWDKFGDELFKVTGKSNAEFVMKPMNCPHHTQIYASHPRSYKELPIRYAETTMVYRDEQQGELIGLGRVRSITQDDGHVFCTFDQIEQEVENIVNVIREFYQTLNMYDQNKFWVSLSVRDSNEPDKYLGEQSKWEQAETTLETIAKRLELPYKRVEGEAAFYGPKLDFMFYDALGRERQLATAQLDFIMPERFKLEYTDNLGEKQTPVMIHRAIAGSLERFMAIMIEHFAGSFPTWLSPVQAKIIPVTENHITYAKELHQKLTENNIRAEINSDSESLGKKIRKTKQEKIPLIIVVGDKEVESGQFCLEGRNNEKTNPMADNEVIDYIKNKKD